MDYNFIVLYYFNINPKNTIMQKNKLIILGVGESGIGAALLAKKMNYDFLVIADKIDNTTLKYLKDAGIPFSLQNESIDIILQAKEVIKSPGIPNSNELILLIRDNNIPIISEIEFAYRHKGSSKIIAITGSNGKSTTTSLIHYICSIAEINCSLVGNIGISIAKKIAEEPTEWYITEVSSFQLDDIIDFKPDIAILLNITPDHLDRYDYEMQNYINSKFKIAKNLTMQDTLIYNLDDPLILENITPFLNKTNLIPITMKEILKKGVYITQHKMHVKTIDEKANFNINDFALKGIHNVYNTMAATVATFSIGIKKEKIREAINTYEGLEHRMEVLPTIKNVTFINDSKATNINSTWYALESIQSPVILILGGIDKGNHYEIIKDLVKEKVKAILCLGKDNNKIIDEFKNIVPTILEFEDMIKTVQCAFKLANQQDVVLLSPACASFDLFKNYEDRGKQFKEAVLNL